MDWQRVAQLIGARLRFMAAYPQPLPTLALLLLVGAGFVHFHLMPQHEAAIESAEQRIAAAERALRDLAGKAPPPQATPEEARARLLERFPAETAINATLGALLDLARSNGLDPASGDYRLAAARGGLLMQYSVTLPLKGDYQSLRRYLIEVHERHPGVAVEDISLHRDSVGTTGLEAQLRLVIFARRGQA